MPLAVGPGSATSPSPGDAGPQEIEAWATSKAPRTGVQGGGVGPVKGTGRDGGSGLERERREEAFGRFRPGGAIPGNVTGNRRPRRYGAEAALGASGARPSGSAAEAPPPRPAPRHAPGRPAGRPPSARAGA